MIISKVTGVGLIVLVALSCLTPASAEITSKIVVIGGRINTEDGNIDVIADVEKLDLTKGSNSKCVKPDDYPINDMTLTANTLPNGIVACGGLNDMGEQNACYQLESNQWSFFASLTKARLGAASVVLSSGDIWVTGGMGPRLWFDAATTELVSIEEPSSKTGPSLPAKFVYHCAVAVNQTHVFLGTGNSVNNTAAWLVNVDTEEFRRLPDMRYPRLGAGCGLIQTLDGAKGVVVARGLTDFAPSATTSEIFLLATEEWMDGPDLPREFGFGGHVNPTDGTLVLAGGMDKAGKSYDDIIVLDSSQSEKMEDVIFEMTESRMQVPRFLFAMAAVYDSEEC